MAKRNGGIIGKVNTPTTTAAVGVWRLQDQFNARKNNIWPTFTATGGTVTSYGSYTVHTFTGNGTFTVSNGSKACDILIVAGGAGGGGQHGGGGGAGGLIELPGNIIGPGSYSITIGGKGLGSQNGSDTTAFSQTAKGGGRGGSYTDLAGGTGGVGGGGGGGSGGYPPGSNTSPAGTTNQGSVVSPYTGTAFGTNGGSGQAGPGTHGGGGGGGAGNGGNNATEPNGANGGAGRQNDYATGSGQYYAAGGGGGSWNGTIGSGGTGGGGDGSLGNNVSTAPSATTKGSGGGGNGGQGRTGGSGDDGIVVIRYLT